MTDWIYVTAHGARRWHQRTTNPGFGPRVAWQHATRVDPSHLHGDEIRYHAGLNVYLVVKQQRLVTVVVADQPGEPRPGRDQHAESVQDDAGVVA